MYCRCHVHTVSIVGFPVILATFYTALLHHPPPFSSTHLTLHTHCTYTPTHSHTLTLTLTRTHTHTRTQAIRLVRLLSLYGPLHKFEQQVVGKGNRIYLVIFGVLSFIFIMAVINVQFFAFVNRDDDIDVFPDIILVSTQHSGGACFSTLLYVPIAVIV